MGGLHAALTDQFSSIFNNAAGYRGIKSDFTVSNLTFKITGPVSTMVLGAQSGDIQQILGDLGSSNIGLEIIGPISIGRINNDMAWGIYNNIDTNIFIPDLTQDAEVTARVDLGGVFGYSFGIDFIETNSKLDFGFLTKLFFRSESSITKSFTDLIDAFSDISSLLSPDSIPLSMGFGVGIDLGMKYVWNDTISVGLAIRDVYTPLFMFNYDSLVTLAEGGDPSFEYSTLPTDYSIGVMYTPQVHFFNGLIGNIKIMFDYNDIFDFALNSEYKRNILLHLGLGFEFTIFDILALRFGLYEGLPAVGLGLDLHIFKFDFAMFGRELSSQPGFMSVYNLMVGIEFSY
ncbi:MAG: hypothetical protein PF518_08140 [Spirochaetaceae bacterium]|jgi:hypothetical protein|nr:hypothetical protein [Spirochaetaceae bacterium]